MKEYKLNRNSNMTFDSHVYARFLIGAAIFSLIVLFSALLDKCSK